MIYRSRDKSVSDRREREVQRHTLGRFDDQNVFSSECRRHNPYNLWLTLSCDPDEASLPNLYQERVVSREVNLEISLRAAFAINGNSALFDQSSCFCHRR